MSAFSGASFFDGRYGRAWGIPAYVGAVFTGYSRVYAEAHFVDDVVAGASIVLAFPVGLLLAPSHRGGTLAASITFRSPEGGTAVTGSTNSSHKRSWQLPGCVGK